MACLVQLTVTRLAFNESPREAGQAEMLQLAKIFPIFPLSLPFIHEFYSASPTECAGDGSAICAMAEGSGSGGSAMGFIL